MTQDCEKCNGKGLLDIGNGVGCDVCKGTGKIEEYIAPVISVSEHEAPIMKNDGPKSWLGKIFS
jgi:DnaJ-class molecular chaperone